MACKHTKTRKWKTKAGYVQRCASCGRKRQVEIVTTPECGFRRMIPGLKTVLADGSVVFDIIDVTTHASPTVQRYGKWGR